MPAPGLVAKSLTAGGAIPWLFTGDVMDNPFDETRRAVGEATAIMRAVDGISGAMAHLLIGRLRHCSNYDLADLKKELAHFNAHTKRWS